MILIKSDLHLCIISCFRGLTQVPDREVIALYDGTHVSLEDMNTFYGTVSILHIYYPSGTALNCNKLFTY